ncbi:hypothetical protein [Paraburkholderia sediminicola]|uniref:hypothetical protein n=1 Tax=Paraburkholderia sediminicola TaxID=458836 RepID=UPI0038BD1DB2
MSAMQNVEHTIGKYNRRGHRSAKLHQRIARKNLAFKSGGHDGVAKKKEVPPRYTPDGMKQNGPASSRLPGRS